MQRGERQLHLGLDACDADDPNTGGLPGAVVQQGRFTDARLAPQNQRRALAVADVRQQPIERPALAGSAQQTGGRPEAMERAYRPGQGPGIPLVRRTGETDGTIRCAWFADTVPTDTVVIVTGGSTGSGREFSRALAGRGYAVVVVYLDDQRGAEAVVDEIVGANGTAIAVRADITDELDVERLFSETVAAFGGVDVIVHADPRADRIVDHAGGEPTPRWRCDCHRRHLRRHDGSLVNRAARAWHHDRRAGTRTRTTGTTVDRIAR